MRSRCLTRILCIFLLGIGLVVNASESKSEAASGDHIIVYYFHGDVRCVNCHNIEKYTKETLDRFFKKDIDGGRIIFRTVNVDKKENGHFIDDYQLYTRAVVVSVVKDGQEVRYRNLQGVWEYLRDKQRFLGYIRTEVDKYLKELG